jgi:ProP effector
MNNTAALKTDERVVAVKGIELLAKAYSKCFFVNEKARVPLKVGISNDIASRFPPGKMPKALGLALRYYVGSPHYLKKLVLGAKRIGLDGVPAGAVTAEQEKQARMLLAGQKERRKKRLAREAAKPVLESSGSPPA